MKTQLDSEAAGQAETDRDLHSQGKGLESIGQSTAWLGVSARTAAFGIGITGTGAPCPTRLSQDLVWLLDQRGPWP
jgi:hypothetical protein